MGGSRPDDYVAVPELFPLLLLVPNCRAQVFVCRGGKHGSVIWRRSVERSGASLRRVHTSKIDGAIRGGFRVLNAEGWRVPSSLRTFRSASLTPSLSACFNCGIAHRVRGLGEMICGPLPWSSVAGTKRERLRRLTEANIPVTPSQAPPPPFPEEGLPKLRAEILPRSLAQEGDLAFKTVRQNPPCSGAAGYWSSGYPVSYVLGS